MSTLSVEIPASINRNAQRFADQEAITLSELVSSAVGEKLAAFEAMEILEVRARKGSHVNIESILAKYLPTSHWKLWIAKNKLLQQWAPAMLWLGRLGRRFGKKEAILEFMY
jgi:hypothetical protein